jgi:prepilin-type processing-associated H-X9-DG protein
MGMFRTPSETFMFGDAMNMDICWQIHRLSHAGICGWQVPGGCGNTAAWEDPENGRHNGGSNLAYMDGHVKWQSGTTIIQAASQPPERRADGNVCGNRFWGNMP